MADAFAASLRILVNEAMCAERSAVLQAQPFERTEARTGYANGFKPKTLTTRLGAITPSPCPAASHFARRLAGSA